jgi:hypothetical protein
MAALGAIGLCCRACEQGLAANLETERYEWYREAIAAARQKFYTGNTEDKIAALRDVEKHAYEELRQFMRAHRRVKFLL